MRTSKVFNVALKRKGMSQAEVARNLGWSEQLLSQRLNRKRSITVADFFHALDVIGYYPRFYMGGNPEIEFKDRYRLTHFEKLRIDDLFDVLDALDILVVFCDKENGEVLREYHHYGRPMRTVIGHKAYDTSNSELIASSFYADGVNMYNDDGYAVELYRNPKGLYFIVEYYRGREDRDRIRIPSTEQMMEIILDYKDSAKGTPV